MTDIRKQVIEACAQVCDQLADECSHLSPEWTSCVMCADGIRAIDPDQIALLPERKQYNKIVEEFLRDQSRRIEELEAELRRVESWKETAETLAHNQRNRAEKAEAELDRITRGSWSRELAKANKRALDAEAELAEARKLLIEAQRECHEDRGLVARIDAALAKEQKP